MCACRRLVMPRHCSSLSLIYCELSRSQPLFMIINAVGIQSSLAHSRLLSAEFKGTLQGKHHRIGPEGSPAHSRCHYHPTNVPYCRPASKDVVSGEEILSLRDRGRSGRRGMVTYRDTRKTTRDRGIGEGMDKRDF